MQARHDLDYIFLRLQQNLSDVEPLLLCTSSCAFTLVLM